MNNRSNILPNSVDVARLPTPIILLKNWSEYIGSATIWMKRDDLTGMALSGNKVRKLEFAAAEALDYGASVLITCGDLQSNHTRATAVLAAQLGLKSHLVLRGEEGGQLEGNLLLDRLVGAEITFVSRQEYATQISEIMENLARQYNESGERAYVIPEGASNAIGAFGYAKAVREMKQQLSELAIDLQAIICATGSGGTQAGLILGRKLFEWKVDVIGFNVCDDRDYFYKRISNILQEVKNKYIKDFNYNVSDIRIIDGYVGEGYGITDTEEMKLIAELARREGIILDPVYTGKAMMGMVDQIKKGTFEKNAHLLFLHSGGLFSLFPYHQQIQEVLV